MTETQRNITRYQLKQWGNNCCTGFYEVKWQSCIANALNYYDEVNNVISQLIYLKFKKHKTKAEICDILYIGSTTYNNYKKEFYSTLAIYAASRGCFNKVFGGLQ